MAKTGAANSLKSSLSEDDIIQASIRALGVDASDVVMEDMRQKIHDAAVAICRETKRLPSYRQISGKLGITKKRVQYWAERAEAAGLIKRVGMGSHHVRVVPLVARGK